MAQEGPKRGPREPKDGPKSTQERSKNAPRVVPEAIWTVPKGGGEGAIREPPFLIDLLQNGPESAPKASQECPRRAP
eukprot:776031-Pyramimonas_sp.AAC.1